MANVIMHKGSNTLMFTVYSDGTYVAINGNKQSEVREDFAALYIQMREDGWEEG